MYIYYSCKFNYRIDISRDECLTKYTIKACQQYLGRSCCSCRDYLWVLLICTLMLWSNDNKLKYVDLLFVAHQVVDPAILAVDKGHQILVYCIVHFIFNCNSHKCFFIHNWTFIFLTNKVPAGAHSMEVSVNDGQLPYKSYSTQHRVRFSSFFYLRRNIHVVFWRIFC